MEQKLKIIIPGGTGLIGQALSKALVADGHEVWVLTRSPGKAQLPVGVKAAAWDGKTAQGWADLVGKADAIINLTGATLARWPWTEAYKKTIRSSRVNAGRALMEAVRQSERKPSMVIQIAGTGYYGDQGDRELDEGAAKGNDFLAGISEDWEAAARPVREMGVRYVILRTAPVIAKEGGLLPPFKLQNNLFAGGPLGSGRQYIPWIHLDDLVNVFRFLLDCPDADGVFNTAAPQTLTMAEFGRTVSRVMRRPFWLPAPAIALKLVLGEMSAVVLEGQRVMPKRLLNMGFRFRYERLQPALENVLGRKTA